jgi:hypothetical protein
LMTPSETCACAAPAAVAMAAANASFLSMRLSPG